MTQKDVVVKRAFDLIASGIALLLLWPVIVFCVLLVRGVTEQSGIYRQKRIGRNGVAFTVFKIRSMRSDQALQSNTVTTENDPRITQVGRVLRRWKLDELPQLWNVFIGDMSFVGPRPDVPGYADKLTGEARRVLSMRPGITGPATIKYRDEESMLASQLHPQHYNDTVLYPDKVKVNLDYANDWSLIKDLQYILMTIGLIAIPSHLHVYSMVADGS